jgi:hypothetical protein
MMRDRFVSWARPVTVRFGGLVSSSAILLAVLAGIAQPQVHATGYVFIGNKGNPIAIGHLAPGGAVNTIVSRQQLGGNVVPFDGVMDFDNSGFIVADTTGTKFVRIDSLGRTTTIQVPPHLGSAYHVVVNPDGNYDFTQWTFNQPLGVFTIDRMGRVTTVFRQGFYNVAAFCRDVHTGDYWILDGNFHQQYTVWRYSLNNTFKNVTYFAAPSGAPATCTIDMATGDFHYFGFPGGIQRVTPAGKITTISGPLPGGTFHTVPLFADRASARNPRLVAAAFGPSQAFTFGFDLTNHTVTTLSTHSAMADSCAWFPYKGRNITTIKSANGVWDIALRFPTHPGRGYVAPLTLSGVRPGFMIGGRRVLLNPDALTFATLHGVFSFYTGSVGFLNSSGAGTARLDVSSLPGFGGTLVNIIAVVLDPAAPNGIAIIADPVFIVL